MLDEGFKAVKLLISGRVQGVCFRHWTVQTACEHSLDGWVRNLSDGNVEALLVGKEEQVDAVILKCNSGPPEAVVDHIEVTNAIGITPKGFSQKPTLDVNERRGL